MFKRFLFVLILVCSLLMQSGTAAPLFVVRGVLESCDWDGFLLPENYLASGASIEHLRTLVQSRLFDPTEIPRLYQAYDSRNGPVKFFELYQTDEILENKNIYVVTEATPLWMYAAAWRTENQQDKAACRHLTPDAPPPPPPPNRRVDPQTIVLQQEKIPTITLT